jgi:adenylate kinase family enzyme
MSKVLTDDPEAKEAQSHYANKGQLVPDNITIPAFFRSAAKLNLETSRVVISDGFPRTPEQADHLLQINAKFILFDLVIDRKLAIQRVMSRARKTLAEQEVLCDSERNPAIVERAIKESGWDFCEFRMDECIKKTFPMIEFIKMNHPKRYCRVDCVTDENQNGPAGLARFIKNRIPKMIARLSEPVRQRTLVTA